MSSTVTKSNLEQKKKEAIQNTFAAYEIGEYYYSLADYKEAVKWYEKASMESPAVPMAQYAMGYACQNGEGTEVDLFRAFQYYEAAAQKDLPQACINLAYFYQNGIGVSRDLKQAKRYSERASESLKRLVDTSEEAKEQVHQINLMYSQTLASVLEKEQKWIAISDESAQKSKKIGELEALAEDCSKAMSQLQKTIESKDAALAFQNERYTKMEALHTELLRMIDDLKSDLHRQQLRTDELNKQCLIETAQKVYIEGQNAWFREERESILKEQDAYQKELLSARTKIGEINSSLLEVTASKNRLEKEIEAYKEKLNKTTKQKNSIFIASLVLAAIAFIGFLL